MSYENKKTETTCILRITNKIEQSKYPKKCFTPIFVAVKQEIPGGYFGKKWNYKERKRDKGVPPPLTIIHNKQ